ncbi:hypothetical protein [Brevibacillus laterosporus]|nr:hypothetical protein [Brevibacillus laterosporus]
MTLTVIAAALSIIAAILGIINNSFGILDRLSKFIRKNRQLSQTMMTQT